MRRWVTAFALAAAAALPLRAAASDGPPAPYRTRIGSGGTCVALGWYLGLGKVVAEGELEFGLRLTFSRRPPGEECAGPSRERALPGGDASVPRPLGTRAEAMLATLAAYGMLPDGRGLERFPRAGRAPGGRDPAVSSKTKNALAKNERRPVCRR